MRPAKAFFGLFSISWLLSALPAFAGPALLFDPANGKLLYAEDPDSQWYPASLTKIMTSYIAFQAIKDGKIKLDQKIPCSLVATLQPPSKVGLLVGAELTVEKALQAVIIKSANDVTVMLAEAISGNETAFVAQMNATAKKLGMTRTNFVNTNGLPDPGQVTTARDLAKLSRAVTTEFPQFASYWAMPDMRIGNRRLGTHNALLKTFPGADGLKTGFTCDSGFNIVASATRDGRKLMAVVLGETSGNERAVRAASLLEHGFQTYGWKDLFNQTSIDNLPLDTAIDFRRLKHGCFPQFFPQGRLYIVMGIEENGRGAFTFQPIPVDVGVRAWNAHDLHIFESGLFQDVHRALGGPLHLGRIKAIETDAGDSR